MKILLLGAGAVGGYFGGRLYQAGLDVTFLTRQKRADILAKNGLIIKSEMGNLNTSVKTILKDDIKETYNFIILACKAYHLDQAIEDIKLAVGKDTYIIPLINGLDHFDVLDTKLGKDKIIRALCFVNSKLSPEGEIIHSSKLQKIVFGSVNQDVISGCGKFESLMSKSNLDYIYSKDIMQDLWEKFVFITSAAGLTCLMRADIATILNSPYGEEIALNIFNECIQTAEAAGYKLRDEFYDRFRSIITNKNLPMKTSLLIDIENRNTTESDHIIGSMINHANRLNVDCPVLKTVYCHIKSYEKLLFND
ncbi:MAG: ketopantoate reductase family protein [Vampirovibrionia bacterium]